ncbi:hypothetical protein [Halotalea alkalilenta]|uniref:hypothetical protein n=1 Tax=Halotalea alkalilenta TaxID=376489 RepID=UPI0012373E68|nr:hypothetical protein [Halotalea alkalilenta]
MSTNLEKEVACLLCGIRVKKYNLQRHQIKHHCLNPDDYISCSFCRFPVKNKNYHKHIKCHLKDITIKSGRTKLCDMMPAQRRRWLDNLDRPDREYSEDALSPGRYLLGGSYGLGKNRKN